MNRLVYSVVQTVYLTFKPCWDPRDEDFRPLIRDQYYVFHVLCYIRFYKYSLWQLPNELSLIWLISWTYVSQYNYIAIGIPIVHYYNIPKHAGKDSLHILY